MIRGELRDDGDHSETMEPEHVRLARGWRRSIQVFERLRRLEAGRPLLELVKD